MNSPEQQPLILCRDLIGNNEVYPAHPEILSEQGTLLFSEYLKTQNMNCFDSIVELAQVLKIPCDELLELSKNESGYLTQSSCENIQQYLDIRITRKSVIFLHKQCGKAGSWNNSKAP